MSINLSKGQTIDLVKHDGGTLHNIRMGLGWDAKTITKKGLFGTTKTVEQSIDLDASAVLISQGRPVETVFFQHLRSKDGSIQHTGDNVTGKGDGDDESILVNLDSVSPNIDQIVFTVNSYSGESFREIENAVVRVVDSDARDTELARYSLTGSGNHTAMVMAVVSRSNGGWTFKALGVPGEGRTANQISNLVINSL